MFKKGIIIYGKDHKSYWADFSQDFSLSNITPKAFIAGSADPLKQKDGYQRKTEDYSKDYYVRDSLPFHPAYRLGRFKK